MPTRRLVLSCIKTALTLGSCQQTDSGLRASESRGVALPCDELLGTVGPGIQTELQCTLSAGEPYHARSWVYVRLPKDLEQ